MKRKVDWDEEEESDYENTNASEDEESHNEEPRMKDVLEGLSLPGELMVSPIMRQSGEVR